MLHPDPDERDLEAVRPGGGDSESNALRRVGEAARSLAVHDPDMHEPPAGLWDRITAETAKSAPAAPAG